MSSPGAHKRRHDLDVYKLMDSKYEVTLLDDSKSSQIQVKFYGPAGTVYEGGVFLVLVHMPESYPFSSPSIGFMNRIYHPNIDEKSGSVCLDVINQCWTPLYDLINVFDMFLPQLLTYPNPTDPLNAEAAALYLHSPETFKVKVQKHMKQHATEEAVKKLFRGRTGSTKRPREEEVNVTPSSTVGGPSNSKTNGGALDLTKNAPTKDATDSEVSDLSDLED